MKIGFVLIGILFVGFCRGKIAVSENDESPDEAESRGKRVFACPGLDDEGA